MNARGPELPMFDESDARVFDQVTLSTDELTLEPETDRIARNAPRKAPSKRSRGLLVRVALAGLVLGVVGGTVFVLLGGVGAVMVAGGAIAGLFLYGAPVIDPQLTGTPATAPAADQGTSSAKLVVMPDPGRKPEDPPKKQGSTSWLP